MSKELTNLLPDDTRRAFMREYFFRLATLTLFLFALVVTLGAVMLAPSYLAFSQELHATEQELARVTAQLENAQDKEVGSRLMRLQDDATHLSRLVDAPSAADAIRAVLQAPHEGIKIAHIAFTVGTDGKHVMSLSGSALTRSALQRYEQALRALPFIASLDLPISTYAKEVDLEFIITLTGTFTP